MAQVKNKKDSYSMIKGITLTPGMVVRDFKLISVIPGIWKQTEISWFVEKADGSLDILKAREIKYRMRRPERVVTEDALLNSLYYSYAFSAEKRNHEFSLSIEEFKNFIYSTCYYCKSPPSNIKTFKSKKKVKYNGIDRIDNSLGYSMNNCVPCCGFCNYAKQGRTQKDFLVWLNHLANTRHEINLKMVEHQNV